MYEYKDIVIERLNKLTKNNIIFLTNSIKFQEESVPITDNFNYKAIGYANNFRIDKDNIIADLYFDESPTKRNIANKYVINKANQSSPLRIVDCELLEVSTVFDSDNKL